MSIAPRIACVGLFPYAGGETVSTPYGDGGLRWLFDPEAIGSIAAYFRDVTAGEIDLGRTEVLGGFRMIESTEIRDAIRFPSPRALAAQAAADTAAEIGIDLSGFDGVVFIIGGATVDAGATSIGVYGRLLPCALLDDRGSHAFMCHEVGHIVGLDHTYQSAWSGGLTNGEYGDPADLMSAMAFGGTAPSFALTPQPGADIGEGAALWSAGGPGLSPATVWRYLPGFPTPPSWVRVLAADAPAVELDLARPGNAVGGTRLVAIPIPGGWRTLEYRPAVGWDRNRPAALVVHRIADIGTPADGPAWPRTQCVDYEDAIPLPRVGDDDWDNGRIGVRVIGVSDASARVLVGTSLPDVADVRIGVDTLTRAETTRPSGIGATLKVGESCQPTFFTLDYVDTPSTVAVTVRTSGFSSPWLMYHANGQPIGGWQALGAPDQTGGVSIPATVAVPTGWGAATDQQQQTVSARFTITGNQLLLYLDQPDGTFPIDISVSAADGAAGPAAAQTGARAEVTTLALVPPAEAIPGITACLRHQTEEATAGTHKLPAGWDHFHVDDLLHGGLLHGGLLHGGLLHGGLLHGGLGAGGGTILGRGRRRGATVGLSGTRLAHLQERNPRLARGLAVRIALGSGVPVSDLHSLAADLQAGASPG